MLRSAAAVLMEHFSSVQIVAVHRNDDQNATRSRHSHGQGSWYERFGATRLWVEEQREGELENARIAVRQPPEEA